MASNFPQSACVSIYMTVLSDQEIEYSLSLHEIWTSFGLALTKLTCENSDVGTQRQNLEWLHSTVITGLEYCPLPQLRVSRWEIKWSGDKPAVLRCSRKAT